MIRVVTEENFSLLDAQIEQAYRRRRRYPDDGLSRAVWRIVENDIALLEAVRCVQGQVDLEAMWLMRLESDLADLSREATSRLCGARPADRNRAGGFLAKRGQGACAPRGRPATRMASAIERRLRRGAATPVVANRKRSPGSGASRGARAQPSVGRR
jgi:hypothetical protein